MKMTVVVLMLAWLGVAAAWGGGVGTGEIEGVAGRAEQEQMTPVDAKSAVALLTPGFNIGNTLENTTKWETGWGQPLITREFVQALAKMGFRSVRLPVAWDTYAKDGKITEEQFARVAEVVDWITEAGMFCVVNIHWDGGWIDSSWKEKYPTNNHVFSAVAEKKFRSYWEQIARRFAGKNEKLIFEGFNEESNFEGEGSEEKRFATLTRVNQIFIDTVRETGGNNAERLLIVPGYKTDIRETLKSAFRLPKDTVPGRMLLSIHFYTPWPFVGMNEDASWGKKRETWGTAEDLKELNSLFDDLAAFSERVGVPVYVGEFSMASRKEAAASRLWTMSVYEAAIKRGIIPVLWDTGGAVSRNPPHTPTKELLEMLASSPGAAAKPAGK